MAITVPSVTYGSAFGDINKAIWFEVIDNYNDFVVDISVDRSQDKGTNLSLINLKTGQIKWVETFPKSVLTEPFVRSVRILHVPNLNSIQYVFLNNAL